MSHREGRIVHDADSHIMELPDFLKAYADPALRDELPEVDYTASIVTQEEVDAIVAQGGRHSDEHRAEMIALGDGLIAKSKEIQALGAFDASDRKTALDLLGFDLRQEIIQHNPLVFLAGERLGVCRVAQPLRQVPRIDDGPLG